ncbi:uncharacterized protein LTR77_005382 [Saxophila tyrrhenica]|uniref:RBR-type E3 ubiquitin transferase n=1 Tax=Saxophila tyrrhenica TaxID=1690608 RepID=A0AAV9P8X2_9PEZI|nr:hypothetical protein LTR77_005382 [Saxophila tyrrhenica]
MVTSSFWGSRSRHATKSRRPHYGGSSSVERPKRRVDATDEPKNTPDEDELRKRRLAYYAATPLERRRINEAAKPKAKPRSAASLKGKSASIGDARHKRKEHGSSSTSRSSKASREESEPRDRTAEYVYGPSPPELERIDEEGGSEGNEASRCKRPSAKHHHSSSKRRSVGSAADRLDELVMPNDSISQVGSQSTSQRRRNSAYARPSLKRSSTTSVRVEKAIDKRLEEIAESYESGKSAPSSRKATRPEPTLLGSVFRRHSTTSVLQAPRLVECLTCGSDDVPSNKSAKLACDHRMCHDCLKRLFELSVKDPAHMPPKCCTDQHIPLNHVDKLFDIKFKTMWNRKFQEYHTKNRLYCPKPRCGHWIKPSHIHTSRGRKFATCPKCKTEVCALCNNKMHKSSDCPKDPEIAEIIEQAKKEGWQRCYSCNAMVERKEGCNHMTCRCMAEFCIVCGLKWKSCNCPWFNYSSLPNPDRLNDMRIPEPVQVMYRRVFAAAGEPLPPRPPRDRPRNGPLPEVTYQREMDERRRQERLDADLARRLQLASLMEPEDELRPRRRGEQEAWGLGNAARHFLNDDFVQNAANVVMNAFGDANMGRRGERASGRRRPPRSGGQNDGEPGLPNDFLGDASVLGVGPSTRLPRSAERPAERPVYYE